MSNAILSGLIATSGTVALLMLIKLATGIPIRDPSGHMVGTLCVYDDEPRQFTTAQIVMLRSLAHLLEKVLRATA